MCVCYKTYTRPPGIEATNSSTIPSTIPSTNMCTAISFPQRFMLMRERRVIVILATNGLRGWASGLLFSLASLVQPCPKQNEWTSLVIFLEMAFKMEVYWSSIKEVARCYWITARKPLVITLLMRPSSRVSVSRKLSHLISESIYSHSVLFLYHVRHVTLPSV